MQGRSNPSLHRHRSANPGRAKLLPLIPLQPLRLTRPRFAFRSDHWHRYGRYCLETDFINKRRPLISRLTSHDATPGRVGARI